MRGWAPRRVNIYWEQKYLHHIPDMINSFFHLSQSCSCCLAHTEMADKICVFENITCSLSLTRWEKGNSSSPNRQCFSLRRATVTCRQPASYKHCNDNRLGNMKRAKKCRISSAPFNSTAFIVNNGIRAGPLKQSRRLEPAYRRQKKNSRHFIIGSGVTATGTHIGTHTHRHTYAIACRARRHKNIVHKFCLLHCKYSNEENEIKDRNPSKRQTQHRREFHFRARRGPIMLRHAYGS